MNIEQSNKYIELVKTGNYDDMFDYGKEIGVEEFKKRLVDRIVMDKREAFGALEDDRFDLGFNSGLDTAIALINNLK